MSSKGRPYRTLVVEGFEVLVGRGDEDNDHLTFDVAEPRDLWLHVAGGTPGSHVIVRNPDGVDIPKSVFNGVSQTRVTFRVKNLTDKRYAQWGDPGYTDQIILGAPRSYEVAASFKW